MYTFHPSNEKKEEDNHLGEQFGLGVRMWTWTPFFYGESVMCDQCVCV